MNVSNAANFTNLPTSTNITPTLSNQLITKAYADSAYEPSGNLLNANNIWSGNNTFNKVLTASGGIAGPTGSFNYLSSSNNTYLATTTGNVGIGKSNPSYKLDVSGNVNINGNLSGNYNNNNSLNQFKASTSGSTNFISVAMNLPFIVAVSNENYNYPFINTGTSDGSGGYIWLSTNSGATFTKQTQSGLYLKWSCVSITQNNDTDNTVYIHAMTIGETGDNSYYTSFASSSPPTNATWIGQKITYSSAGYLSFTGVSMNNTGQYRVAIFGDHQNYGIFYSSNYGSNWTTQYASTDNDFYGGGIALSNSGIAYATWKNNLQFIIRSTDNGQTWYTILNTNYANNIACSSNGQYVTAVGPSSSNDTGSQIYDSSNANASSPIFSSKTIGQSSSSVFLGVSMSPSGKYQIVGGHNTNGEIYISSNYGASWSHFSSFTSSLNTSSISLDSSIDYTGVWKFAVSSSTGLYIYIGEISPYLNITTPVVISNTCTATAFLQYSDYRIKENIEEIEQNIDDLKPVKYFNKLNKQIEYGFIAHEIQDVIPCLVSGLKDNQEYQTVNYTGLIPILIKEIQELKKEIKILKSKIYTLEDLKPHLLEQ